MNRLKVNIRGHYIIYTTPTLKSGVPKNGFTRSQYLQLG